MKRVKKLSIALIVFVLCSTMFSSCKKDDEKTSSSTSPGYFVIEGVRHDLQYAYNTYYELTDDIHPGSVKYIQSEVAFISKGLNTEGGEPTGTGDIVVITCQDPLNQQIPGDGKYNYLPDTEPVKAYTYYSFTLITGIGTADTKDYYPYETVKVKKSGDVYEFSSSGTTDDGKAFEFYYKGKIQPTSEIIDK